MRVELLYTGVHPGRLGSPRDKTLRKFLGKKKKQDTHELMANLAASLGNADSVKEQTRKYINAIWYDDLFESRDKDMMREWEQYKHLTPELVVGPDGRAIVRGLS